MQRSQAQPVEWMITSTPVPYPDALAAMNERAAAIHQKSAREAVWLLEHPACYTAGTSANPADLVAPGRFPVFETGRGGQFTYHGPGQRIAYAMLDLTARKRDVRAYVDALEGWLIDTLDAFNVRGERRKGRVGVWVTRPGGREDKVAAIGVRVKRWVTLHGISLNVEPDLAHFSGIVPCGVRDHGVTSLFDLGLIVTMEEVDQVLRSTFEARFGRVEPSPAIGQHGGPAQKKGRLPEKAASFCAPSDFGRQSRDEAVDRKPGHG